MWAQTAPPPLTSREAFTETWLDSPPERRGAIVGSSIVGLRLDPATGVFDPEAVSIAIGDVPRGPDVLCIAMISRDGRYSAHAA